RRLAETVGQDEPAWRKALKVDSARKCLMNPMSVLNGNTSELQIEQLLGWRSTAAFRKREDHPVHLLPFGDLLDVCRGANHAGIHEWPTDILTLFIQEPDHLHVKFRTRKDELYKGNALCACTHNQH